MSQDETHDRSIRNSPHGQQMVINGARDWVVILLTAGLLACTIFCALAWNAATRSAERAFQAQQSAAINREYAVQVVGQLNRMGYPVISPGEKDHPLAQPADYAALEAFRQAKLKEQQ